MIVPVIIGGIGLSAGFLLIWRVPRCMPPPPFATLPKMSLVIPARNEEQNLPWLLRSIVSTQIDPIEIIVVDDGSIDNTAFIAGSFGARVVTSDPLPAGWTGKTWACYQGAAAASGELLLFLDADTCFLPGGLASLISRWTSENNPRYVVSILPYHAMSAEYEQLSLVFNLLMAAGAGGFGLFGRPRLFGQSLLMSKAMYIASDGHAAVRGVILENLRLAALLRRCGAHIDCFGGHGLLHMRMFPGGFRQMSESWIKAFVQGASYSGGLVIVSAILWISALWSTLIFLIAPRDYGREPFVVVYFVLGLQLVGLTRQLGNYRLLTCFLYPLPLAYYCIIFGRSAARRIFRRKTVWRGREV